MEITTELVTPAIATAWLERNTKNRKLSDRVVANYAQQMRDGQWTFDGDPIRFDTEGDMIDGQHRCWAVIESDTEQSFVIMRGIDPAAMATMNTGKRRSFADILTLHHHNIPDVNGVASATAILYRWEQGARGGALRSMNAAVPTPNVILLDFYNQHSQSILDTHRAAKNMAGAIGGVTPSALVVCMWVFADIDQEDADFFWARLRDGTELSGDHPILTLRNYLQRTQVQFGKSKPPVEVSIAFIIKAWNAYREGNAIRVLSWRRGGANPEAFPIPA